MHSLSVLWSGKYFQCWENALHSHDYYQIIAVVKGSGIIQIGDERFTMESQNLYLIPPCTLHGIYSSSSHDLLQLADIKFNVGDGPLNQQIAALGPLLSRDHFDNFLYYFERILRESELSLPYSYERICMYFGLAMTHILRYYAMQTESESMETPAESSMIADDRLDMEVIVQYIRRNYTTPITLDDLLKVSFVSKKTLTRAFKQTFNTTPARYINMVRLEKAKELLLNTDSTISQIAEMVGFQSPQYFSRYFKAAEKLSPWEYRQCHSQNYYYMYRMPIPIQEKNE